VLQQCLDEVMDLVDRRPGIGQMIEDDRTGRAGAEEHGLDGRHDDVPESSIELP
jgi:hypothetical protein